MKKFFAILVIAVLVGLPVFAEGETPATETNTAFGLDGAVGLSFGLFDDLKNTAFGDLNALATLASVRGGGDVSLLYTVNEWASVGGSLGVYILQFSVNGGNTYTFFDVPVRAVAKLGDKNLSLSPYLGYYWTPVGFPFPGLEAGARLAMGGLFLEAGYVLGQPNWKHINLGFVGSDFFRF
jgi:hypothetical protein